ncbi:hypothetical protein N0V88_006549 [Collariella sp. IMI 366227]|nr:hypothetical protein N0V88_006549 [Collariella sp. IMI 366227]
MLTPGKPWFPRILYHCLRQLVFLSCPNLKTLAAIENLAGTSNHDTARLDPRKSPPALKNIVILPWGSPSHWFGAGHILPFTPNVETVYVLQVHKLVAPGLSLDEASLIPLVFPALQDLHYTHFAEDDRTVSLLGAPSLTPLQTTLQRLTLAITCTSELAGNALLDFKPLFHTLVDFSKLEELEICQLAIYATVHIGDPRRGRLVPFLPPSIVSFHITHVGPPYVELLLKDLAILAEEAPRKLPSLKYIKIGLGLSERTGERHTVDKETRDLWVKGFAQRGLVLSWGASQAGDGLRDIPGLPLNRRAAVKDFDDED